MSAVVTRVVAVVRLLEGTGMIDAYARLCEAVAGELFGREKAGQPVYALAEDDALARIVRAAGLESANAKDVLLDAVRSTLHLDDDGVAPLRWHYQACKRLARSPLDTPTSLPLLVVLTMAAESMQAGSDMAANNYYGRLFPLLRVPTDRQSRFISDYRNVAEVLWGSLNAWLEAWEGERGVPTAYAVGGMRYIGLPMSQAVVRRHDREGLHDFFALEGLPPGFRMGAPDMESALEPYATKEPSPLSKNLRRLWTIPPARERIVLAACLELEAWAGDGRRRPDGSRASAGMRLVAYLRTFPRKVIEFNLAVPTLGMDSVSSVTFPSANGSVVVPAVPGSLGTVRLADVQALDAESLLGDQLTAHLGNETQVCVERRPRRVVPLRWDELQGSFVEVERVAIGEDNLVLARDDATARVETLLTSSARPGWEPVEGVSGLPEGWSLFRQVQIVSAPEGTIHVELTPLVPRARTSLTLRGGFAMPGRLRKWSSFAPPEVVALAAGARTVNIRVFRGSRLADEDEQVKVACEGELAIVPLHEHGLDDGEYTVGMYVDEARKPASTATLRLRSANTPLFNVAEVDLQLVYAPDHGARWPLSAGPATTESYINGARVVGGPPSVATEIEITEYRPRAKRVEVARVAPVRLGRSVAPDSCMTTGKHRFQLPPAEAGRPRSRTIEGECTTCGLVKRFAATAWAAKKKERALASNSPAVVIPPVVEHDDSDQHIAFDALSHVGHGSYSVFERIAGQIEGSGLFADTFIRRQEVTGHLDVRRDERLQVAEWAVNAPTLVPVSEDTWVLIGARSQNLVTRLREMLGAEGRLRGSMDAGILRLVVEATSSRMEALRSELSRLGITLLDKSPAMEMAAMLPPLSAVEEGLKRIPIPAFKSLEVWDTSSATWLPATSIEATGAFRLRDFGSIYLVRSRYDLASGSGALATAQLAKHIANSWARDPLIGYHSRTGSVVVPLGADLPALYGRVLSVCSGKAPRELPDGRMVQYPDVPRQVANAVLDRLTK
jgi:hypothetical protein